MARPLKVSEILAQIKGLLESTFPEVLVEGEVSNFSKASSGHYYFSLSDEAASISVAFFRGDALLNPLLKSLADGQKVIVVGRIGVYPKRGTFQIIGAKIYPFGAGNLKIQFELLKKKLAEKGLFDLEHKKSIPPFPRRVAIITALDGAALQDFRQVYQRRSVLMDILVVPSLVQGEQAALALCAALKKVLAYNHALQEHPAQHAGELPIEVVVLARGGGSMEDLWCFNDEALAYAIYDFPLPLISAVGHQVDFTIADFVADQRAETPTAAAELLTAAQIDLRQRLGQSGQHLKQAMLLILMQAQRQLAQVHPRRWEQALKRQWQEAQAIIRRWPQMIWPLKSKIQESCQLLDELKTKMMWELQKKMQQAQLLLTKLHTALGAGDPRQILGRGYTMLTDEQQKVVSYAAFQQATAGQKYQLHFKEGVGHVAKETQE